MPTRKEYEEFLERVAKSTGLDAFAPDKDGLVSLRVEETYTLNLQYVERSAKILCFVEVANLPKDAGRAVYRDLLVGGLFGKDTGGGFFSLEPENETVVFNYLFDFDPAADPETFSEMLEQILSVVDIWAGRIRDDLIESGDERSGEAFQDADRLSDNSFFINP